MDRALLCRSRRRIARFWAILKSTYSTRVERSSSRWTVQAAVGVVALMVMGEGSVELAKMGVRPQAQGKGAGRMLVTAAVVAARGMGMKRV